jgi:hypothetical protein
VSSSIERLRFYDGEYLRSFDFEAEQSYHVAMRRRLNQKLHLSGVVEGLTLGEDTDSVPGAQFFSIAAGMAIDQLGREMIVPSPYVIRRETDLARKDITAGQASVWLCYRETAATPPSVGYGLCNDAAQNTRWLEQYDVVLVMIPKPSALSPKDDPDTGRGGIRLGTVTIASTADGLTITSATNDNRSYIGIRAQTIIGPAPNPTTFNILGQNSPIDPAASLEVVPNVFADASVIIGPDFEVKPTDFATGSTPPTVDPTNPKPGYLKVANSIFLNGALYMQVSGKWLGLDAYIKSLIKGPDIQIVTMDINPSASSGNPPNGTETFLVTSALPAVGTVQVLVSITSITRRSLNDVAQWVTTIPPADEWIFDVSPSPPPLPVSGSVNQFNISVRWSIGPKDQPSIPANAMIAITKMTVSCLVIFNPPPSA